MSKPKRALRPTGRIFTIVLVALVIVVGTVVGLGGLNQRATRSIRMEPGQVVDQVMMEYTVSSATVYHSLSDSAWYVTVTGQVRNPNSESLPPTATSYSSVLGVDEATSQYIDTPLCSLGPEAENSSYAWSKRQVVPPDSEWMDIRLRFKFEESYEPSDTFSILFRPMEYRVTAVLGFSNAEEWAPQRGARNFVIYVPLTHLPNQ